mmetsp:Transcript_39619/g.55196  ORF Transcript_39619/g.55196 Transcript_39619/m.55196 type:complete len:192 (-) Transcript_39619:129-704(-)|eukprot:CAMPEP_0201503826 /NCGR_PEP_ID=MMETSP0151_2-20130828/84877_1 /ASSEMBLY_ACC=CAM_ASM_000257 /TAXON_ID=200890 /ORGANISM="Paramoeba atlantica, Strain 621/1 / CCAP 1560/9" /LENGTH=191 /DNA_ID=CAMNT_0047897521 /DNA_START=471 /DNA_END=1046 /DNA_ORIENTATION=+
MELSIAICGPSSVGKSAITIVYLSNHFPKDHDPTIEDSFKATKEIDGERYLIEIVDTAGAEEFEVMRAEWMRRCEGFVIVYSITDEDSFRSVDKFHDDVLDNKDVTEEGIVPMVLVGNKCDLDSDRKVSASDATAKSSQWKCPFLEASAKANINVQELFAACVKDVIEKRGPPKKDSEGGKSGHRPRCVLL